MALCGGISVVSLKVLARLNGSNYICVVVFSIHVDGNRIVILFILMVNRCIITNRIDVIAKLAPYQTKTRRMIDSPCLTAVV